MLAQKNRAALFDVKDKTLTSESSQALGTLAKVSIRRNNKLRSPSWTFVANFIKEKTRSLWCASIADLPTKSFQEKG